MAGSRQQHRRVPIVTAGVHATLMHAPVCKSILFGDRQRIDVSAQSNSPGGLAGAYHPDESRATEAAVHGDAPLLQSLRDPIRGALLLKRKLRVRVQVASERLNVRAFCADCLHQRLEIATA
jgi:hypothetical protein